MYCEAKADAHKWQWQQWARENRYRIICAIHHLPDVVGGAPRAGATDKLDVGFWDLALLELIVQ
jgi:hypothetical protein